MKSRENLAVPRTAKRLTQNSALLESALSATRINSITKMQPAVKQTVQAVRAVGHRRWRYFLYTIIEQLPITTFLSCKHRFCKWRAYKVLFDQLIIHKE